MVVLVSAVWGYFVLVLAPSVPRRWRSGWQSRRWQVIAYLGVAIPYGWFLVRFLSSGWLGEMAYATEVEALAAVAQVALAAVLIVFTYRTVQANHVMAQETKKMAQTAAQQQRAATRPVLVFRLHAKEGEDRPTANAFAIEVFNVGAGAALNTRIRLESPLSYDTEFNAVQPLVVAPLQHNPEEKIGVWFTIRRDAPFVDANNSMRWPANEEDVALIQALETAEDGLSSLDSAPLTSPVSSEERNRRKEALDELKREKGDIERKVRKQKVKYVIGLANHIAGWDTVGQVRADYDDLAGTPHVSAAKVAVQERVQGH
jgi:hypothetical protein